MDIYKPQYLNFYKTKNDKKKTYNVVVANKSDEPLAYIEFKNTWRTYVVSFEENIVFDQKCLSELLAYVELLNLERKIKNSGESNE